MHSDCLPDYNMQTALTWGREQSLVALLPASLADVGARARFVEVMNQMLGGRYMPTFDQTKKQAFLQEVLEVAKQHISEQMLDSEKMSIGLRLWSGCLSAAKTVAGGTRDGPNNSTIRKPSSNQSTMPLQRTLSLGPGSRQLPHGSA
jgi:hypothetical protein